MDINYFTRVIKGYLVLAVKRTGAPMDHESISEIDDAMDDLASAIATLWAANQKLVTRVEALEAAIEEDEDDDGEISGAQYAAAKARGGRT